MIDNGRGTLPLQFRIHLWRSAAWQEYVCALNAVAQATMTVADGRVDVKPVEYGRILFSSKMWERGVLGCSAKSVFRRAGETESDVFGRQPKQMIFRGAMSRDCVSVVASAAYCGL
ncbi:hypothetical protein ABBQ32_008814 [Trebouxia sp. C0010 RCD-2024]